jgi:tetratricopeptide (TPR) repeat protein
MNDPGTASRGRQTQTTFLQRALKYLERSELAQSEDILNSLLSQDPMDAEALQLLGLLRQAQGSDQEAEDIFRRSLAINPLQPNVHNNLGALLKLNGRLDESVDCFREAVRLRPNYAEALLNLALALSDKNDHVEAEKCCRAALRIQPNFLLAKQALASELNELQRPHEAEKILRQALMTGPRNPQQLAALQHTLGISLKMQKRDSEALAQFDSVLVAVPEMPVANYNRGNTLQRLGRQGEAVDSYFRALQVNPMDMNAHDELNKLLYRLGDDDRFLVSYDEAASLYPERAILPMEKGRFLFLLGRDDAAREAFERAIRLAPDQSRPHDGLALVFARTNDFEAAIREHEIVVGLEPDNAPAWRNFGETLLRSGDPKSARVAAERAMAIQPDNQAALAIWTLALRLLGDPLAAQIDDCEKFVRVYELPPPRGYGDMASFNSDLNAYLDGLHRDRREFVDQTLRNGTQTMENLFGAGHSPVELLRERIDYAVSDFIERMETDPNHPLTQRKSSEFKYAGSWSARLHDCGFHTNHIHPKGWISSAYYVALPDVVATSQTREGWIQFGQPNFECGFDNSVLRTVRPKVGTLVLFPSYTWHGTLPFRSTQARTTIAFDVVPDGSRL